MTKQIETTVKLTGVHLCCQGCVNAVRAAIESVRGVKFRCDMEEGSVTLRASDETTAQKALDIGIPNWVVPRAELETATSKLVRRLADGPTFALGKAKQLLRSSLDNSWDEHSHREAEFLAACAATEDHFEGLNAFLEKRTAKFKGR